jgi:hypothetical protein
LSDRTRFAEEIISPRQSFVYLGKLSPESWGYVFGRTRDSEAIVRANWDTIQEVMEEFTEDWAVEEYGDWLNGWMASGRVRIYVEDDPAKGFTDAFEKAYEITQQLASYPVLDEDRLAQYEIEEEG